MDRARVPAADSSKESAFTRLETITAFAVVGVLALALGLIALAMPTSEAGRESVTYHQSGHFGYGASAPADSVYGDQGLVTGEPILSEVVGPVTARFDYRLSAPASRHVRGTTRMVATVHTADGLTRDFTMADVASFSGAHTSVSGVLPVSAMMAYVRTVEAAAGGAGITTSTVVVTPRVKVHGSLDGHRLATSFAPSLSFDLDGSTLRPSPPAGVSDPGASLKPTKDGKIGYPVTTTRTMSLLLAHPAVSTVRIVGLALGGLCLLLALWLARPLWRTGGAGGQAARIRALYGSRLVDVRALSLPEGPVADVAGMEALAELAKRYESMILHVSEPEAYLVWDNGKLYRYRPVTELRPVARRAAHTAREA
jgi:hypothetical protein